MTTKPKGGGVKALVIQKMSAQQPYIYLQQQTYIKKGNLDI